MLRRAALQCRTYSSAPTQDVCNAFITSYPSEAVTGLRVSIKDNFAYGRTTCASKALENYASPYEATVVKLMKRSGATIVGKTNMDEFGMGSFGEHSHFGAVRNPLDSERVAGGSSSGAAASVASGLCDVAIGSDTGGSIRLPASYTGTIGFKPSYGLISRHGLTAYASSLDTVGVIAQDVSNIAQAFETLNVYDKEDPTAIPAGYRKRRGLDRTKRLRIGLPLECFPSELTSEAVAPLRRAISDLRERLDAEVVSVSIPSTSKALSAYYTIASAEASSNLARYDGVRYGERPAGTFAQARTEGFGDEVKKRIILGTYALTADAFDNYFLAAQRLRIQLRHDTDAVLRHCNPLREAHEADSAGVDLLMYPSAISPAPILERARASRVGVESYVQDILTVPASLGGLPALSFPIARPEKDDSTGGDVKVPMPVGVQLVGQWGFDELVLEVARVLE